MVAVIGSKLERSICRRTYPTHITVLESYGSRAEIVCVVGRGTDTPDTRHVAADIPRPIEVLSPNAAGCGELRGGAGII